MENKNIEQIKSGLTTAFIDQSNNSNLAYRPEFVYNDYKQGKKVLVSLEQELKRCDEFFISVAFITDSGFESLAMILKELERKGIPGKILTTDYLTFSQPKALDRLAQLSNIELKMYRTNSEVGGFHTKGYIFREDELYRIIIGSSNMTSSAITKNREWNTKIVSTEQGEVAQEILAQFNELWDSPNSQVYEDFIEDYKIKYLREKMIQKQHKAAMQDQVVEIERYKLTPNKMQIAFIDNLTKLRLNNAEKALLVSSTGTGKTLASAFAVREMNSARILFIAHREQIAKQALNSYRKVFGNERTFGLISGNYKDMDADYIFSTMQMMSKSEVYTQFNKEDFDIIVLDECHHAGSNSYQKIMSYFKPKFWLGMTASPDTNNYDIYEKFIEETGRVKIMYKISNFSDNDDVKIIDKSGPFEVIEYQRDLSVMPEDAQLAFFCSQMNVRKRQLKCELSRGNVTIQSGAMQWMAGDVSATTGIKGAGDFLSKTIRGKVTGESVIKPEYTGDGTLVLEPTYKHIILLDLDEWGNSIVLDDGLFLACESTLKQKAVRRKTFSSAFAGGEGFFNLGLKGSGVVCIESDCPREELVEITLEDDVVKIDGNLAIAWSGSLDFTVERAGKSLLGSAASGEGLVNVYRGTGKVLLAPVGNQAMKPQQVIEKEPVIVGDDDE